VQRIRQDDFCLAGKDENQRKEKSDGRRIVEFVDEGLFEVLPAMAFDDADTCQDAAGKRNDDEEEDA
jgi:hypothetical protein